MKKFVDKVKAANWSKTLQAVANLGVVATSVGVSVGVAAAEPLAKGIEDMAVKGFQSATLPSTMTVGRNNKGDRSFVSVGVSAYLPCLFHPPREREGFSIRFSPLTRFRFRFPRYKEAESLRREQQMVQRAKAEAERKVLTTYKKGDPFLIHLANQPINHSIGRSFLRI